MNEVEVNNLTNWLTEEERKFMGTVGHHYKVRKASTAGLIKRKLQDKLNAKIRQKLAKQGKPVIVVYMPNQELKIAFQDRCGQIPTSRVIRWLMVKYIEGDYGDYETKKL